MNIVPQTKYETPNYPTWTEARTDSRLLDNLPARWQPGSKLAKWVSTGLALQLILGGKLSATEPVTKAVKAQTATQSPSAAGIANDADKSGMFVVAPILQEALNMDGRGSFGCVAVSPPVFLPEDEAIDLIRKTLAAAGIKLREKGITVPNVSRPLTNTFVRDDSDKPKNKYHAAEPFEFDGASEDGGVVFEYISRKDFNEWAVFRDADGRVLDRWSSVSSYDFADAARKFSSRLSATSSDRRHLAGVFFDPLARPNYGEIPRPTLKAGEEEIPRQAWREYREKLDANGKERAKERLQVQVQAFIQFLKKESSVPPKSEADISKPPVKKAPSEKNSDAAETF